ncbi:MAG: WG repeat-containing protein [Muribaculaceae bacterium]|jgi:hypothetical protein|nr:WG repeat-containing protein [Muribaculaceae bacterium]
MKNLEEKTYGNLTVVERPDYTWGVVGAQGEEIVPFGKYDWIDGFDQGLARVKIGKGPATNCKWGIINESGEEVLPAEYDEVWNFLDKGRSSTKVVKDGHEKQVQFSDLNPDLRDDEPQYQDDDNYYENEQTYGEYAGTYAQDVAGYSDQAISDAFDGDPDAYWNID